MDTEIFIKFSENRCEDAKPAISLGEKNALVHKLQENYENTAFEC